MYKINASVI